MCCVPRATRPALEATALCGEGCPGLSELLKGRGARPAPLPWGRGAGGKRGQAPGGWRGHRGRCSDRAASAAQERSYLQSEFAAISGEASLRKAIWREAAAEPRLRDPVRSQGCDAQGKCSLPSFPAASTGCILACFVPNSEPEKPGGFILTPTLGRTVPSLGRCSTFP